MPESSRNNRFSVNLPARDDRAGDEAPSRGLWRSQIVVPTGMTEKDRAALLLGLQLTQTHKATLTVLHVLPPRDSWSRVTGFDALGLLHRAAHDVCNDAAPRGASRTAARVKLAEFVESTAPQRQRSEVDLRLELRTGDVAERIARFAEEVEADLLILSSRPAKWWRPLLSPEVRRVLRQTQRQVILAPCQRASFARPVSPLVPG